MADKLDDMGYAPTSLSALGWGPHDFLGGWWISNNVLVVTHGAGGGPSPSQSPPRFVSDRDDDSFAYPTTPPLPSADGINGYRPDDGSVVEVTLSGYEYWRIRPYRVASIGTGLPPFNSGNKPPLNLMFVYACSVGTPDTGSGPGISGDSLYPNGNVYTGVSEYPEHQSNVMSDVNLPVSSREHLKVFYSTLKNGYSMRVAADNFAGSLGKSPSQIIVKGDHATRLSKVYLPNATVQSLNYWRVIQ
ncbi:MAG: hypothetical protein KF812_09380 [Fimbriimonadaceae bacterium]|nr:hypothetical protein [Fimbriimonadaceae bacterium]